MSENEEVGLDPWVIGTKEIPFQELEEDSGGIVAAQVNEIVQSRIRQSPDGQDFDLNCNTKANRQKLIDVIQELKLPISWPTLSRVYGDLRASDAIKTHQEVAEAKGEAIRRGKEKARKAKIREWTTFLNDPKTTSVEINRRAAREADFDVFVRQGFGRLEQAEDGFPTGAVERPAEVPYELKKFAEEYKTMLARDVRRKLLDPDFRNKVEAATAAGLI